MTLAYMLSSPARRATMGMAVVWALRKIRRIRRSWLGSDTAASAPPGNTRCRAAWDLGAENTVDTMPSSRALVASSHSSTLGLVARARAMAMRCCWPPDSWAGYAWALSGRPTSSSSSRALDWASFRLTPASSMGKQMFCRQVRCISRLNRWKIMVISRRAARSWAGVMASSCCPLTMTLPLVGRSSILMQRTSVLLPAPLMPMMP